MATKREENILGNSFKDWEKLAPLLMEAATDKSTLLNFAFLDSCDKISRLLASGSPAATITERFLAKSIRSATEMCEKKLIEKIFFASLFSPRLSMCILPRAKF